MSWETILRPMTTIKGTEEQSVTGNDRLSGYFRITEEAGMGYNSEFIDRFSLIRGIAREMFVNGYLPRDYALLPPSTLNERRKKIYNYLRDSLLFDYSQSSAGGYITVSEARMLINPFYRLFKTKKIMATDISFHYSLLSLLVSPEVEVTREELFDTYNEQLQYDLGLHADFFRIHSISIDGVPVRGKKPIQTLIDAIGEEAYRELRARAIREAQEKMGASVAWGRSLRVFACGQVFKCFMAGREISRRQLERLLSTGAHSIDTQELLARISRRAQRRHLGRIELGKRSTEAVLYDADHIITIPEGELIALEACREMGSEEQFDDLCLRIFNTCARFCRCQVRQHVGDREVSFSLKKALTRIHHIPHSKKQSGSFNNSLKKYVRMGLLHQRKEGKAFLYAMAGLRPFGPGSEGLLDRFPGLRDALVFFSEDSPLGILGSQIMDASCLENELFSFRDRYVSQTLDSIVLYDLLEAIREKKLVRAYAEKTDPYMQPVRLLQPVAILSDMQLGRQFLFGWDPSAQKYASLRLDIIRRVAQTDAPLWDEAADQGGQDMLSHVWSSRVWNEDIHHLQAFISYDPQEEPYIRTRVYRECRNAIVEEIQPGFLRVVADVYDPMELMPWLLSFTGRIEKLLSPDSKAQARFCEHVESMLRRYARPADCDPLPFIDEARQYSMEPEMQPVSSTGKRLTVIGATHSPIYESIANSYLICYDHILREMEDQAYSEDELRSLIRANVEKYAYRRTAQENRYITLEGMLEDRLIFQDEEKRYVSSFGRLSYRPFTACELSWMRTILDDPKMSIFLTDDEIGTLRHVLGASAQKLYDRNTYRIIGTCSDADPFGEKTYREHFQTLMNAIRHRQMLSICYITKSQSALKTVELLPLRLEFSRLRNKFSLYGMSCDGRVWIIRLSTIQSVQRAAPNVTLPLEAISWKACERALTVPDEEALDVIVSTEVNALERFMLEFQVYRKESRYHSENKLCRVRIWYYRTDCAEMIAKLLRFGKAIEVLGPPHIRSAILQRVQRQHALLARDILTP